MKKLQSYIVKFVLPILFIIPFTLNYFNNNEKVENHFKLENNNNTVFIKNDKISILLHLKGGFIDNFNLKTYEEKILTSFEDNECFESGWINNNIDLVPNRFTQWKIESYNNNSITIFTDIGKNRFYKIITLKSNEVLIREYTNCSIPGQYFTVISVNKDNVDNNLFVFANNKLFNTPTSQINNHKITPSLDHVNWMGISNNFLGLFCEYNNNIENIEGKFFYKNNKNKDKQLFFLSDSNKLNDVSYRIILIEKIPILLSKYNFQEIINYGLFFKFISKTLSNFLYFMYNKNINPVISLFLLALIMILIKIWFIIKSTEEYYKIYHHLEEKDMIANTYDFSALENYYRKYNVNKNYFSFDYMITFVMIYFTNKAINSFIFFYKYKFLWIQDISIIPSLLSKNFIKILFFRILLTYLGTRYQYRVVDNMNMYISFIFMFFITSNMSMSIHLFLIFAGILQEIIHYIYLKYLLTYKKIYIY
ncbi:hypothetical protein AB836_01175 [Rickettsiales bacterium (ex Bugula neritina AB1)]|nr:hypothetical protein AB836_01175 [Rickettsiales bacterium (ex Bugula neritina AB1)]